MARHDRARILETGVAFDGLSAKSPSTPIRPQTRPNPSAPGRFRFKPGINVNNPQMTIEPTMPAKKPSQLFFD